MILYNSYICVVYEYIKHAGKYINNELLIEEVPEELQSLYDPICFTLQKIDHYWPNRLASELFDKEK